jgi:WD40-like Beta Propeller Repeat
MLIDLLRPSGRLLRRASDQRFHRWVLALAFVGACWGTAGPAHATFPGENGVIVFESSDMGGSRLMRVSPGNSTVTLLGYGKSPSVSPNGRQVAFYGADVNGLPAGIFLMNMDGTGVVQVRSTGTYPTWAPDGSKLAFIDQGNIWTMNPNGTGATQIVTDMPYPYMLEWQPNGGLLLVGGGGRIGFSVVDPFSGAAPQFLVNAVSVSWTPTGDSVLALRLTIDGEASLFRVGLDRSATQIPGNLSGGATASPDGLLVANGLIAANRHATGASQNSLVMRASAGSPTVYEWPLGDRHVSLYNSISWGRVPKGCFEGRPQGGSQPLAGDVNFYAEQCAVVVMPDGGGENGVIQQVMAIGPDGRVYHRTLAQNPLGGDPVWSPFALIPGANQAPQGIKAGKIAIAGAKDGSAQVVVVGRDDNLLYHALRYSTGVWTGFSPLDGPGGVPNFAARDVSITISNSSYNTQGSAQVIANGQAVGRLYHRVRDASGAWTPFQVVPGMTDNPYTQQTAIAAGDDGDANVVVTTTDAFGTNTSIQQAIRNADTTWTSWVTVGVPRNGAPLTTSTDVAVGRTQGGNGLLLYTDAAGNALYQVRSNPNQLASWSQTPTTTTVVSGTARQVSVSGAPNPSDASALVITGTYPQ